jgi:hypothetical protein
MKYLRARPKKTVTKILPPFVLFFLTTIFDGRDKMVRLSTDFTVKNISQAKLDTTVWYTSQEKTFSGIKFIIV